MSFTHKIEVSDRLLLQPLNMPEQVDASSCLINAIFKYMVSVATMRYTIANSRKWYAIQIRKACVRYFLSNLYFFTK